MKRDFEDEDEFREIAVISREVMTLKFCEELSLKVRLYLCVISPLIPFYLVCHHKAVCLIFGAYIGTHTHTQTVSQACCKISD